MLVTSDPQAAIGSRTVVALGNFDGVHLGHQAILQGTVEWARQAGGTAVALTFDPMPMTLLRPESAPRTLTPVREKSALLAALGLDVHLVIPFTQAFANLSPQSFVDGMLMQLHPLGVCCGYNYTFGMGARGKAADLEALCAAHGVVARVFSPVEGNGVVISSTAVRRALEQGDVHAAAQLLGRPYEVAGPVVMGDRRGGVIGFPTANVGFHERRQVPALGVYAVRARTISNAAVPEPLGPWRDAMANLGKQPTFGGEAARLEVHLFDFSADLYGQTLAVQFWHKLRDVQRFAGLEALVAQLRQDEVAARAVLAQLPR